MEISNQLIINSIYTGLFALVMGIIIEKILKKLNRPNNILTKTKEKNYCKFLFFSFAFGFLIRFILEYIGFEAYCEKKCNGNNCNYTCTVKINNIG
jgi:hypothetical protein